MTRKVKVADVQSSPVFKNLEASLDKAVELTGRAAAEGASLVTFGETWLPDYPAWLDYCPGAALWNHEPTKQVFAFAKTVWPCRALKRYDSGMPRASTAWFWRSASTSWSRAGRATGHSITAR